MSSSEKAGPGPFSADKGPEHGVGNSGLIDEAAEQKVIRKLDRWIVPPGE
jgi:hypothetical protein